MSIHTSLVFIDPGPGQGSKGSSNKLLSVGAPGEVNAVALQLTFGVPLCTHPGIVFKLTAIPTDTRSNHHANVFKNLHLAIGSGISPSHNSIRFRSVSKGLMIVFTLTIKGRLGGMIMILPQV